GPKSKAAAPASFGNRCDRIVSKRPFPDGIQLVLIRKRISGTAGLTASQKPAHPPLETLESIEIPGADLNASGFLWLRQASNGRREDFLSRSRRSRGYKEPR
ncbi:MAG: hypothetical protein K9M82_09705, partial [Deltaproteobacteria bacterium]|nr:hypothetical protein [Deltaproteobacteria bacterium]